MALDSIVIPLCDASVTSARPLGVASWAAMARRAAEGDCEREFRETLPKIYPLPVPKYSSYRHFTGNVIIK